MNWFSGKLEVRFVGGASDLTIIHHDVSLAKAQAILDAYPKGSVETAMYTPYAISMAQSR